MKSLLMLIAVFLISGSASAQESADVHSQHAHAAPMAEITADTAVGPVAQDWAKQRVDKSPRHQEWVPVKYGTRTVNCFVVYPEVKGKATAVVVIHEIFGMSDWVRSLTDQLAEAGYVAIAPDLLSGMGPNGGGSNEFTDRNGVTQAVGKLPPDQVTADLKIGSASCR